MLTCKPLARVLMNDHEPPYVHRRCLLLAASRWAEMFVSVERPVHGAHTHTAWHLINRFPAWNKNESHQHLGALIRRPVLASLGGSACDWKRLLAQWSRSTTSGAYKNMQPMACLGSASKDAMQHPTFEQQHIQEPAAAISDLVELALHACGSALYLHLGTASRRCLRLVCKAGRSAVDGSARRMEGYWETVLPVAGKERAYPRLQLPALNSSRWCGIKEVVVSGQPRDGYRKWGRDMEFFIRRHREAGLPHEASYLPLQLEVLKLIGCLGAWNSLLQRLPSLAGSLHCLELSHNQLSTEMGMSKALASLTQLQRLRLECNDFRQEYFDLGRALDNMQQLRELVIDERWWPPEIMPKLEWLPDHVASLSQLQVLHLSMPLPVKRLASMLACLTALQDLHFHVSSCYGDSDDDSDDDMDERDDGDVAELAPALLAMPELRVLGYVCRDMVQGMRMVQQLTGLQGLVLQGSRFNSQDAEAGLQAALLQLNRLTSLDLSYCTYWSGAGPVHLQEAFKQLPQLQHLDISHNHICYATNPGSQADLHLMSVAQNEGVVAAALQHLTGLQHLNVSAMQFMLLRDRLQDEGRDNCMGLLAALQRMKRLRHLNISLLRLKDDTAPLLAQVIVGVYRPCFGWLLLKGGQMTHCIISIITYQMNAGAPACP